jgi:4-hydroxy-tetrahydrodipicolinate reductase
MGRLVAKHAADFGFELAGLVSRHHPGAELDAPWVPGLDALGEKPSVLVDFTLPAGAAAAARWCAEQGVPLVSGTTGLDETQRTALELASHRVPVLHAANFSPGVNLMLALLREAGAWLEDVERITLTDVHHVHKKDAPSGTALAMADALAPHGVDIESRREGEVIGDHRVTIRLPGEVLGLEHHAEDRAIFARGALQAARWLIGRPHGYYGARDALRRGLDSDDSFTL